MFPTLDPPPVPRESVGHWVVVCLNLKDKCFQYIDSLYGVDNTGGWQIFKKMEKNIRKLWNIITEDHLDSPLTPLTLDAFETNYMITPKQNNALVDPINYLHSANRNARNVLFSLNVY